MSVLIAVLADAAGLRWAQEQEPVGYRSRRYCSLRVAMGTQGVVCEGAL